MNDDQMLTCAQAAEALGLPVQTAYTRFRVLRELGQWRESPGDRVGSYYFLPWRVWQELLGKRKWR